MICDFGLSRAITKKTLNGIEKGIKEYRKSIYKPVMDSKNNQERASRFDEFT